MHQGLLARMLVLISGLLLLFHSKKVQLRPSATCTFLLVFPLESLPAARLLCVFHVTAITSDHSWFSTRI